MRRHRVVRLCLGRVRRRACPRPKRRARRPRSASDSRRANVDHAHSGGPGPSSARRYACRPRQSDTGAGASPSGQITSAVNPWSSFGVSSGSSNDANAEWACRSMNPGQSSAPFASITSPPRAHRLPRSSHPRRRRQPGRTGLHLDRPQLREGQASDEASTRHGLTRQIPRPGLTDRAVSSTRRTTDPSTREPHPWPRKSTSSSSKSAEQLFSETLVVVSALGFSVLDEDETTSITSTRVHRCGRRRVQDLTATALRLSETSSKLVITGKTAPAAGQGDALRLLGRAWGRHRQGAGDEGERELSTTRQSRPTARAGGSALGDGARNPRRASRLGA